MSKILSRNPAGLLTLVVVLTACQDQVTSPEDVYLDVPEVALSYAKSADIEGAVVQAIVQQVDDFNVLLEAAGTSTRLDYPWMFVAGEGTDPFGQLRTGARWTTNSPGYILDESDYTTDLSAAEAEATLVSAYDSWNAVRSTSIEAVREGDGGGNFDVLDGLYDGVGNCVFLFDLTSPNIDFGNGLIFPEADIVVGGWLTPNYFSQCLGSASIIGVTWTFSAPDSNGDGYRDIRYVEQFYNSDFTWVTSGSTFLDPSSGVDLETIAAHEDGHTHGLGHFGGPINRQPFSLKPNGRVFNPEAVMNPFYLGGEKRDPLSTDLAALRTLYGRGR